MTATKLVARSRHQKNNRSLHTKKMTQLLKAKASLDYIEHQAILLSGKINTKKLTLAQNKNTGLVLF